MIEVVNKYRYIPDGRYYVYIGRGSPLGNPYSMEDSSENERWRVIEEFKKWLDGQSDFLLTKAKREIDRLAKIAAKGDLVLVCHCAPRPCHGDYIKEVIEKVLTSSSV